MVIHRLHSRVQIDKTPSFFLSIHSCSLFLKRTTVDSDSNPTLFVPRIHSHQRFIDLETGLGRGNKRVSPLFVCPMLRVSH